MATDIGVIKGVIELQDDFSSHLGLAEAVLSNFTKHNQESLTAVAEAGGLVAASFSAIAVATLELGERGSLVNDLSNTLDHFAGSSKNAHDILVGLRAGVQGTVSDFDLMKNATHLLSANVNLNAEDFKLLGEAAHVLQNRGLRGTVEMMDLVSDALVTGRTKALAAELGVIDLGNAEDAYAKKIGVTADQLSDAGKAEAHRVAIMGMMRDAVKDAGHQELDFAERIEQGKASVVNFNDEVASAIAKSPVLAAGMDAIGNAVSTAFGADHAGAIKAVTHFIEGAAIVMVDMALGAVEGARVVGVVWAAIKTVVLSVAQVLVGTVADIAAAVVAAAKVAEGLHLLPEGSAAEIKKTSDAIHDLAVGLDIEAGKAAEGVSGHSDFDKTLDHLGGTLYQVRDAMVEASDAEERNAATTAILDENKKHMIATQKELDAAMRARSISQTELDKIEKKSIEETKKLWNEYYALRTEHGTSALAAQKAQIDEWARNEVDKLDKLDKNWATHYKAIQDVAHEKLNGITTDWNYLHENSLTTLREQAQVFRNTYEEMQLHASEFTREKMEEMLKKTRDAEEAAKGMGTAYKDAFDKAAEAAQKLAEKEKQVAEEAKKAKQANMDMGGSFEITRENFAASARGLGANPDLVEQLLKKGYSFQQALLYSKHPEWPPPANPGPRVPGFAEGGTVMVGEEGPEVVRLPFGSQVFPHGMRPADEASTHLNLTFNVNGTARESANQIKDILMRDLRLRKQFGV